MDFTMLNKHSPLTMSELLEDGMNYSQQTYFHTIQILYNPLEICISHVNQNFEFILGDYRTSSQSSVQKL